MKEKVTCVMCPLGCEMTVYFEDEEIKKIEGYGCENGKTYAEQEVRSSKRPVMSVVRCSEGSMPTVAVVTDEPVPKDRITDVMNEIKDIVVEAPVSEGDILKEDVCGLGVNIKATRSVKKK